jgi:hypothetical protein
MVAPIASTRIIMTKMSTTRERCRTCNHQRRRSRAAAVGWCLLLLTSGAVLMMRETAVAFQQVSVSIVPSNKLILSRSSSRTGASYQESATSTSLLFRSPSSHSNSNSIHLRRQRPRQRRTNDRGIWSNADAVANVYDDDGSDSSNSNKLTRPYSLRTLQQAFGRVTNRLFRVMHVTAEQPPLVQMMIAVALYTFHLTVLTQHAVVFPYQLIPTTLVSSSSTSSTMSSAMGAAGTGIGWDSLAGMATLGLYAIYKRQKEQQRQTDTTIKTKEKETQKRVFPWQLPANNNRHKLSFLFHGTVQSVLGRFALHHVGPGMAAHGTHAPIALCLVGTRELGRCRFDHIVGHAATAALFWEIAHIQRKEGCILGYSRDHHHQFR